MTTTSRPDPVRPLPPIAPNSRPRAPFTVLPGGKDRRHRVLATVLALFVLLLGGGILLLAHFSFSRSAVIQNLEESTGTKLQVKTFGQTYFPHPGCVLENVSFVQGRAPNTPPVITIQRLTIVGSYLRLLAHHVPLMKAEGMHVVFPPFGTGQFSERTKSSTVVGEFVTDNAILEFTPHNRNESPLRFLIHHFTIHELASDKAMLFESSLTNPRPLGEVTVTGHLGPWKDDHPEQSPLNGSYRFERADLGSFAGIAGMLSSQGRFAGTFKQLSVEGKTDTPSFEVTRSGHRTHLTTDFKAAVDAINGDVTLRSVSANFWKTSLQAQGTIDSKHSNAGKTARLEFVAREGRIEDLMMLFIRDKKAPIAGLVSFGAKTTVPPGDAPFLKRVLFEADFGIDAAHFTNPEKQDSMERLSERARGKAERAEDEDTPPDRVLSDLRGHVLLKNGVATFSRLAFTIPGATAEMQGTYDLISERVHLHGTLRMATKLSKTTTGVKSFLLKLISPFTKKEKPAAPIPVSITGTWDHPEYHVSIQ